MGIYLQKDNIMEYWENFLKALISKIDSFEYYKTKKNKHHWKTLIYLNRNFYAEK
jgi:hypothetical protein